ncbi:hypothetical protein EGW08_004046 [Elysia chlorotica]|uniref:RNA-binding protein 48 n=1 Tax=Elysia chlorotica TaxID=188477 RepID=A0A3S1ACC2_ELYCH|nr:hypothetical protein EGW08_004046 [Elysia chlorotica]
MEVPSHHLKQKVCVSRPPYREGRHPKAVKVYTVNNESIYLIIQGVPSVGAGGELNKLCSSFGPVEEFRPLDEYPCEDKYTEVYLIKYKKIQSSRFAKRKLDEYSFFGGCLHVFYAPEYESVQETREKLCDRRQVVAKKIRQHNNERTQYRQQRQLALNSAESHEVAVESRVPPLPLPPGTPMQISNPEVPLLHHHADAPEKSTSFAVATTPVIPEESPSLTPAPNCTDFSQPQSESHTEHNVFHLPLPPISIKANGKQKMVRENWRQYEYSKVPTAHATLPQGYDGRLSVPEYNYKTFSVPTHHEVNTEKIKSTDNVNPQDSQIVIRDYKVAKPALKFVPRQTVKKAASGQEAEETRQPAGAGGSQDDNLRKNAFRLGKVQGPEELPGRKRTLPTVAQQSVNDTILSIRGKISKIIGERVGQKPP